MGMLIQPFLFQPSSALFPRPVPSISSWTACWAGPVKGPVPFSQERLHHVIDDTHCLYPCVTNCYRDNKAWIPLNLNKGAMHPVLLVSVLGLMPLALMQEEDSQLDCVPRRSVPYHSECCHLSVTCSETTDVGSYRLSLDRLIGNGGLITGASLIYCL